MCLYRWPPGFCVVRVLLFVLVKVLVDLLHFARRSWQTLRPLFTSFFFNLNTPYNCKLSTIVQVCLAEILVLTCHNPKILALISVSARRTSGRELSATCFHAMFQYQYPLYQYVVLSHTDILSLLCHLKCRLCASVELRADSRLPPIPFTSKFTSVSLVLSSKL